MPHEDCGNAVMLYITGLDLTDWDNNEIPLYYPDVAASEPAPTGTHIRLDVFNTTPEKLCVEPGNAEVARKWLIQITVCVRDGIGIIKPSSVIDKITDAFPFAGRITSGDFSLKIVDAPEAIQRLKGDGWVKFPVQIPVLHIT